MERRGLTLSAKDPGFESDFPPCEDCEHLAIQNKWGLTNQVAQAGRRWLRRRESLGVSGAHDRSVLHWRDEIGGGVRGEGIVIVAAVGVPVRAHGSAFRRG